MGVGGESSSDGLSSALGDGGPELWGALNSSWMCVGTLRRVGE